MHAFFDIFQFHSGSHKSAILRCQHKIEGIKKKSLKMLKKQSTCRKKEKHKFIEGE